MMSLKELWHFCSNLGVGRDEIHYKREVILLNKMVLIACILVLLFIPIEITLNGFELVPYELISVVIFSTVLFLNKFQFHSLAKHLTVIIGTALILFSTISVGGHSNSEFNLLPIMLLPIIFFKKLKQILPATLMVVIAFYWIIFNIDNVTPIVNIPIEVKIKVQPFMSLMTIVFLFFELYYFKNLNLGYELMLEEQKQEIKNSHDQLEQHHNEIQDSINYAKRIQDAIMPNMEAMHKALGESFVLYLPKDIVAGDFFWMEQIDDTVYYAAADCTGHGVPGAMVSVVCSNALTKAFLEEGIRDTGKLLDRTRGLVINQLAKSGEEVKDGMDISLCAWNKKTNQLQWSGANNSLWILRKYSQEIEETKADKQPIGVSIDPKPFTTHNFQLNEGDVVYLFTDGYQDQFGGPKGKKFKAAQLKEMLINSRNSSILEQRILVENTFDIWKNELEQVDDVCLIGVRI